MSFAKPSRDLPGPPFPLASMLDIMFLVLTFFLTAAAYRDFDKQIDVSLPATESGRSAGPRTQIVVTVTPEGAIYIGEKAYEWEDLRATLADLARQFPNESVVIRGDRDSKLGSVVKVLDLCYALKLKTVYLATTKPAGEI